MISERSAKRRRLSRGRTLAVATVALVVLAALATPAIVARAQERNATDLETPALANSTSTSTTQHITVGDRTYIRGRGIPIMAFDHDDETVSSVPAHANNPFRDTVLVGDDGDLLTVNDNGTVDFHPQGGARQWRFRSDAPSRQDLGALGLTDGTAILREGQCSGRQDCDVIGVHDGEEIWRTPVDRTIRIYAPGDGVLARLESGLVEAPTVGLAVKDGQVVTIDADGGLVTSGQSASKVAVIGDEAYVIVGRETCRIRDLATGGLRLESAPFDCEGRNPQVQIVGRTLYSYQPGATAADPQSVVAISLDDGTTTPIPEARGQVGYGETALVGGRDATYHARDTTTGEEMWRRPIRWSNLENWPKGAGLASTSTDTAAVWSRTSTGSQIATFSGARDRVTLMDLESGQVLDRYLTDHNISYLIALPGHRALVIDDEGRLRLLGGGQER